MKTILCAEYQKEQLYHSLLSKENQTFITDVKLVSLPHLLIHKEENTTQIIMQCTKSLQQKSHLFPIYQKMFHFYTFIQELITFARELILWNISDKELPEQTPAEKELKQILHIIMKCNLIEKSIQKNISQSQKQIREIKNCQQTIQFETNFFYYHFKQQLGIPYYDYPTIKAKKYLYYALNASQELEAIAQNICLQQAPCNIILTNYTNQLPILKQIFQRYQIPFGYIDEIVPTHIQTVYIALLNLALEQTPDAFIEALKIEAFAQPINADLLAYLKQCMTDLNPPLAFSSKLVTLFKKEAQQYAKLEENAQQYFQLIQEDLNHLIHYENYADILLRAYEIMQKSSYLKNKADFQLALKIRQAIQTAYSEIETKQDIRFFIDLLQKQEIHQQSPQNNYCIVSDLTHPVAPQPISYIVGCNSQNFPSFPAKKGLFDETYIAKIPKYPNLSQRHLAYMEQLNWITQSATQKLIYSFSTNDYQGKELQLAYEVETLFDLSKAEKWHLIKQNQKSKNTHTLKQETAKKLFTTNHKIHGSISTIEKWFQCPYSYFIQSGLKIRKNKTFGFDIASIGSIRHSILEQLVQAYKKNYASASCAEINQLMNHYFETIHLMYPNEKEKLLLLKENIQQNICTNLEFLEDFEKNTSFSPIETEYSFTEELVLDVVLHGVIDRIDTAYQQLRIIDYKSSDKRLIENNVLSGIQLQLLTYLIIANHIFKKEPAGAYYYSLKNNAISMEAAHVSRNQCIELDDMTEKEQYLENKMLTGWTMIDHTVALDQNEAHIKGLNKQFQFSEVKNCLEALYTYFKTELLQGNIHINPTVNACTYCDYHNICRHHGGYRKISSVLDESFQLKGTVKGKKSNEV